MNYPFSDIERKWQQYWDDHETFRVTEDPSKQKLFVLDMYPYPSGAGLHVGHPEGYTATDIYCRFKRMCGYNVLHPMGWDAFGLPAERYAMQTGIHPRITTQQNIATFKRQIKMLGLSYDWTREINTTDPAYYKWTQWIFLRIYNSWYDAEKGKAHPISELQVPAGLSDKERYRYISDRRLAYLSEMPVNWCPELGTVLANEEVDEWVGKGYTVERRMMRQWMLRITAYAERLAKDLDELQWSPGIIEMQRNWIGRSEGAEADFPIKGSTRTLGIYTTRPDTMFGATYMVIAPEHPLVNEITKPEYRTDVERYRDETKQKSELERTALEKEKSGVFTGGYAINPATKKDIPIWIADYVMLTYGTGAIMAVPGHDERDRAFAIKHHLDIKEVVVRDGPISIKLNLFIGNLESAKYHREKCHLGKRIGPRYRYPFSRDRTSEISRFTPCKFCKPNDRSLDDRFDKHFYDEVLIDDGISVNSSSEEISLDGLKTREAKQRMVEWLEHKGIGKRAVKYKLRDWLFSRQRYWGEPFPLIYLDDGTVKALPESNLPILLPDIESYKPTGTGESALATATEWLNTVDPETGKHARRETHTMPQWAGSCWYYLRYLDSHDGKEFVSPEKERYWMPVDLYVGGAEHAVLHLLYARFWHKVLNDLGYVSTKEPFRRLVNQGTILGEDGQKMSKSRGNVVNPDEVVKEYGADAMRLFEMFMGPLEDTKPWSTRGVEGVYRFLNRVWRMMIDENGKLHPSIKEIPPNAMQERLLHQTIKKVTGDVDTLNFNTAISQMMIFVNEFLNEEKKPRQAMETFVLLLSPFAPHLSEELWEKLGHRKTLAYEPWPGYDEAKTIVETVEMVVQVNGKVRTKFQVPFNVDDEVVKNMALSDENVKRHLDGKQILKVVVVKNKLVSLVVK